MSFYISQDLLPAHPNQAPQGVCLRKLTIRHLNIITEHLRERAVRALGVSLRLSQGGTVDAVAVATPTHAFYVDLASYKRVDPSHANGRGREQDDVSRVLDNALCPLVGFGIARLALHLHRRLGSHVQGVDLCTLFAKSTRVPDTAAEVASKRINPDVDMRGIHALWHQNEVKDVCLRAWLAATIAEDCIDVLEYAAKVDTRHLQLAELQCLGELVANVELLDAEKPTHMENEFESVEMGPDGQLVIRNARYNNRVRRSKQTTVVLETTHGQSITGHAVRAQGKSTGIKVLRGNFHGNIERIRVVGREELTNSELARDEFILLLLQGNIPTLTESPFVCMLWFPTVQAQATRKCGAGDSVGLSSDVPGSKFATLNASQKEVVGAMWSAEEPIVVAHGPPGTGKTTTIAVGLKEWDYYGEPAWVVAQSNVGVKNIARALVKHDIDFKLIVSQEFYVEWHEHLYESIESHLIRSDDLMSDTVNTERLIAGSQIMLSTVSMLSNPALDNCGLFRLVPVERLVVDEASQIDSFEFMHLFHKFKHLQKVCMFGDPKQLPPYGKETAPSMKTIFDFKHLKPSAYFLNTQYRMPVLLGDFISEEVYNSKLKSVHKIKDSSCIKFVDVRNGRERHVNPSWMNTEEVHAVVNIVKNYYKFLDFCIITPYDAQRAAITQRLEAEGLPADRVFNVDSFQGHEASYVIVSTVRTTAPGFLRSLNRMTVMLTRCQMGMVVVTNRAFLGGAGRDTLLGGLAQRWSTKTDGWVDPLELSDQRASLPGAPGRTYYAPTNGPAGAASIPVRSHVGSNLRGSAGTSNTRLATPRAQYVQTAATAFTRRFVPPSTPLSSSSASSSTSDLVGRLTSLTLDRGIQRERVLSALGPHKDEHFPVLGGRWSSSTQPALKGKWRKGSEACRL